MNADGLSRIAMSSGLAASLSRATDYARAQSHAEVTLEHMLLALCDDPDAALVLAASNINISELTSEVGRQLSVLPLRHQGQVGDLAVAGDLVRILEAAAAAARGGRRREINGAIVLAAIIGDGKSAAAQVLSGLGLTFEGAIRALQAKPAAPEPSARPLPPSADAESILANARERVQSRTVTAPPRRAQPVEEPQTEVLPAEREEPRFEEYAPPPEPEFEEPALRSPSMQPQAPVQHFPQHEPEMAQPPAPAPYRGPEPELHFEQQHPPQHRDPAFGDYGPAPYEGDGYPAEEYPQQGYDQPVYQPDPVGAPDAQNGYGLGPLGPPPMPASAPFPPPSLPPPSPHEGWTPPPSPPAGPISSRLPQASGRGSAPPFQPGPPAPRPGPPPLAPWPEPERPYGGGPPGAPGGYGVDPQLAAQARPGARPAARSVAPRAEIGQLVENIPRSMRVSVPAMVEVRIARGDVQALAEGLQGGGAAYQHEVMITKAMSVRLRAPDGGFYVETASPETQWIERASLISQDDFASWRWHVTPRDAGKRRLQLVISARTMSADGLVAETALPDQVISVRVRTNYGQVTSRWIGWGVAAVAGGVLAKFGEGAFAMLGRMISG